MKEGMSDSGQTSRLAASSFLRPHDLPCDLHAAENIFRRPTVFPLIGLEGYRPSFLLTTDLPIIDHISQRITSARLTREYRDTGFASAQDGIDENGCNRI
jgi:hypothetical protein